MNDRQRIEPEAWAFVLQHATMIQKYAWKHYPVAVMGKPGAPTREDFHQELLLDVAKKFPNYDPSRSAPSTWIWWRARRVKTRLSKRKSREYFVFTVPNENRSDASASTRSGGLMSSLRDNRTDSGFGARAVLASIHLREVRATATPKEWEAVETLAAELSKADTFRAIGVSSSTRNRRLERLRRRLATAN